MKIGLLLVLILHLVFLCLDSFQRSADGWIHLFFASHWQTHWWQDWDIRWYTGFSVFFYPPLAHQLLALACLFLGWKLGAIALYMLCLLFLLSGLYRYARIFVAEQTAGWIVLGGSSLSSLAIGVHVFGQITHHFALACLLHGAVELHEWLKKDSDAKMLKPLLLCLCVCLSNLFTAVLGLPLFLLPILLLQRQSWRRSFAFALSGLFFASALLTPFLYFRLYLFQATAPVYHSSQHNILNFKLFNYYMFYGLYGAELLLIPLWLIWAVPQRKHWALWPSLLLLFVLSLGGSTPLARWILGPLFDALALDRFGHWGSLLFLIPIVDMLVQVYSQKKWYYLLLGSIHLTFMAVSMTTLYWRPLPALYDLKPVIEYLSHNERRRYRYLTLGLKRANQSKLSALIPNASLDGNLPFIRNLPHFNASGLPGLDSLRPQLADDRAWLLYVLDHAALFRLKYIVVPQNSAWRTHLAMKGWRSEFAHDKLSIWLNPKEVPRISNERPRHPLALRLVWGIGPLLCFVLLLRCLWRPRIALKP